MPDMLKQVALKAAPRLRDKALVPLLPHSSSVHLHSVLASRKLFLLGDVIDITCTKLVHRNTHNLGTKEWQQLAGALAPPHKLLKPTDPLPNGPHILPF